MHSSSSLLSDIQIYALGLHPMWAAWVLLLLQADYCGQCGRCGCPRSDWLAGPALCGGWWAGLVQEADGCEALWGPGVNAGPLVRRAGSGVGGCRAGGTGSSVHLLVGRSSS